MFPPVCATVPGAAFATVRSEVAATPACVVDAVAESFAALSSPVAVIEAVFVNVSVAVVVFAGTETTIETVAELVPAARVPRLQVTVAVPVHDPCEAVEDTNVVPAGSVSLTATFVEPVLPVCDAVIE